MTPSVSRGGEIVLPAEFPPGEQPDGPTPPVVSLFDPAGEKVVDSRPAEREDDGFVFRFDVPSDAPVGTWRAEWSATVDGEPARAEDTFEVTAEEAAMPAGGARFGRSLPKPVRIALWAVLAAVVAAGAFFLLRPEPLTPQEALDEGLAAHRSGDMQRAQQMYADVLREEPTNKYALFNLGIISQDRGSLADARTFYEAALAQDSNFVPALFNLGIVLDAQDEHGLAASTYERVIDLDPDNATAYLNLGFVLVRELDDPQRGGLALQRAVELSPQLAGRVPDEYLQPAPTRSPDPG